MSNFYHYSFGTKGTFAIYTEGKKTKKWLISKIAEYLKISKYEAKKELANLTFIPKPNTESINFTHIY